MGKEKKGAPREPAPWDAVGPPPPAPGTLPGKKLTFHANGLAKMDSGASDPSLALATSPFLLFEFNRYFISFLKVSPLNSPSEPRIPNAAFHVLRLPSYYTTYISFNYNVFLLNSVVFCRCGTEHSLLLFRCPQVDRFSLILLLFR